MEKLVRYFFLLSIILLVLTGVIMFREGRPQWKTFQERYREYLLENAATPAEKNRADRYAIGVKQVWLPELDRADRCTTCHAGVNNPNGQRQPPLLPHPDVSPHSFEKFGCTACHEGKGLATRLPDAHEGLTPDSLLEASCGKCHGLEGPGLLEAPTYTSGYEIMDRKACRGCHLLEGDSKSDFQGPSLLGINSKVSREWLVEWLRDPRQYLAQARMANFLLNKKEINALADFLLRQDLPEAKAELFYSASGEEDKFINDLSDDQYDGLIEQGKVTFGRLRCLSCHTLDGKGGTIGPELTGISRKTKRAWLSAWIRSPSTYNPHTLMPTFNMTNIERLALIEYLLSESEFSLLDEEDPGLTPAGTDEDEGGGGSYNGHDMFFAKGCVNCHELPGLKPNPEFAPPLKGLADKQIEKIDFGKTDIPMTLPDYIAVKLQSPRLYGDRLKMPDFGFSPIETGRLTTVLLGRSESIPPSYTMEKQAAGIPAPAGEVGKIFERYKCLSCHKLGGSGGKLAPDLSFEGSKVKREWLKSYLEKPYAIRPYLVERMPRFNMTAEEAETLAQYIDLVLRSREIDDTPGLRTGDPETGRRLYLDKYACQSCHSIDGNGGYYGPALENVSNRLKTTWLSTRLVNSHPYEPGAREPVMLIPEDERADILGFIGTLKTESKP